MDQMVPIMKHLILAAIVSVSQPEALCTTDEHCLWLEAQAAAQGRTLGDRDAPNYVLPESTTGE